MADKAITALTEDTGPTGNDVLPLVDLETGTTKKTKLSSLAAAIANLFTTGSINGSKLTDGTVGPAKRTGGFKVGPITTTNLGSTGVKSITGLGFQPKIIRLYIGYDVSAAGAARESSGVSDGTSTFVRGSAISGSSQARWSISGTTLVNVRTEANSTVLAATLTSLDADGFTFNVSTADASYSGWYEAEA